MKKKFILPVLLFCCLLFNPLQTEAAEAVNLPAAGYTAPMQNNPYLDSAWLNQKVLLQTPSKTWEIPIADLGLSSLFAYHNNGIIGYQFTDYSVLRTRIQAVNNEMLLLPSTSDEIVYDRISNTVVPAPIGTVCQLRHEFAASLAETIQAHFTLDAAPADITVNLNDGYLVAFPVGKSNIIAGACATGLSGSSSNRINNVAVAASHLNNLTILPGQEISVSTVITPRSAANGYREAGVYLNGETVQALGGGICQVSSTLYNAAMNSGLTVTMRYPHSMPVHYLPLGLDAAISAGSKDLHIRNDYDLPVTLQAGVSGKTLTINVILNESLLNGTAKKMWSEVPSHNYANTYLSTYDTAGNELSKVYIGASRYSDPKPKEEIAEIED